MPGSIANAQSDAGILGTVPAGEAGMVLNALVHHDAPDIGGIFALAEPISGVF